MSGFNWERASSLEKGRRFGARDQNPRPEPGITNQQAKYLAALQRRAGKPYTGNGMTRREAARAIRRLERK